MSLRISRTIGATISPPVMEARRWLAGVEFSNEKPLLNLSQAAPVDPPPAPLLTEVARIATNDPSAHLYGPVLGLPELRSEVAAQWSAAYDGVIRDDNVAITSGCNQAFCAAINVVAAPGDAVILPTPWYFNHFMHLSMQGIEVRPLECGTGMLPDPDALAQIYDARVKAIVLVSPNNPTGAEYPPDLITVIAEFARERGIALILDETYRDFHSDDRRPHDLFTNPDWGDTLIHLYSFSKTFRLTGHRVGAMIAGANVLSEAEKYLDTVSICPNQIGQRAALYGLRTLAGWVREERAEILRRRAAVEAAFDRYPTGKLLSVGAYFAFIEHPFGMASDQVARALVKQQSVLVLPGTMFTPEGSDLGRRSIRVAFANADAAGIETFAQRFSAFCPG